MNDKHKNLSCFIDKPIIFLIGIFVLVVLNSCDKGLSPVNTSDTGNSLPIVSGTIYFKGGKNSFPPLDSLKDLRVAFFKKYPDSTNIMNDFLSGNISFTDSTITLFQDSVNYSTIIKNFPVTFSYIAVVQNYAGLLDWRVVGIYSGSDNNNAPKTLEVTENKEYKHVNIYVDFQNLPEQPF